MAFGNKQEWENYLNSFDFVEQLGVELDAVQEELKGNISETTKTNILLTHIMLDLKIIKNTLRK